jgi:hypothetical protein
MITAFKLLLFGTVSLSLLVLAVDPTVKVALIGLGGNILVLILGLMLKSKLTDIHVLINSRLTELLKATGSAARAEGKQEGITQTREKQAIKEQGIAEGKELQKES